MPPDPQDLWHWVHDHPFDGRLLDMRRFALGLRAQTDEDTAARFETLRSRPTEEVVRAGLPRDPRAATERQVDGLVYPLTDAAQPGPVFRAARLEEKWDIDLSHSRLWFSRAWTGEVALVATVVMQEQDFTVTAIHAAPAWHDAPLADQVDYLIWSHLLGRPVPHPVPAGALDDPQRAALWSFGRFGSLAWWASEGPLSEILRQPEQDQP